jgi:hypothetical protein
MTLTATVEAILKRKVTEEEAKDFALNQWGVLISYVRENHFEIRYSPPVNLDDIPF